MKPKHLLILPLTIIAILLLKVVLENKPTGQFAPKLTLEGHVFGMHQDSVFEYKRDGSVVLVGFVPDTASWLGEHSEILNKIKKMKTPLLTTLLLILALSWGQMFSIGKADANLLMRVNSSGVLYIHIDSMEVNIKMVNKQPVADSPYMVKCRHHALLIFKNGKQVGAFVMYKPKYHIKNTIIE